MAQRGDTAAVLSAVGGTALTAAGIVAQGSAAYALPVAISQLLALAGVSASIPVVGWVIAGLAGATAGSIVLVRAIRAGKVKKADAAAQARGLALEDVDGIAGYVVKALRKGKSWRADEAAALVDKIQRNPDRNGKARRRDIERLRFLAIVDLDQAAADRGNAPPTAPLADLQRDLGDEGDGTVVAVVVAAAAAFILSRFW